MIDSNFDPLALAKRVSDYFHRFPSVQAVGMGGSQASGQHDPKSDIDLYVFTSAEIPLVDRIQIIDQSGASRSEPNQTYWELTDEWFDRESGIEIDLMYWDPAWIEHQLSAVLDECQASLGYTTAFWNTILNAHILYDKNGWLHALKSSSQRPYPEKLRVNIIAKNHSVLRRALPSYFHQIEKAVHRDDLISINHRVAALFASYFDVLFALNRLPHPGEKRMLRIADEQCQLKPEHMVQDVRRVLNRTCSADEAILAALDELIDQMDRLLERAGFDPSTSRPLPG